MYRLRTDMETELSTSGEYRPANWQVATICLGILILSILLSVIPPSSVQLHNFLHHLTFIPLVVAGMTLGWRWATGMTLFAFMVQFPHILVTWDWIPLYAMDKVIELSIFGGAGVITGFLADRERGQRAKLERTKQELEFVHNELQQNVEQLKQAERLSAVGQLSAGLAHEIRNPLASISGAAGILNRRYAADENERECLEIIDKESQRLNKLLTSFLDFARPRAPRLQPTNLTEVIDSVIALAKHTTGISGIELIQQIAPDLPEVQCDMEQLKQVLLNLLINAIQATNRGGSVWVKLSAEPDRVLISVLDQGCGIPQEQKNRIFDPFFTTKESGSGLGLAIASKIIEQHGGLLLAEHNADRGMTFRVELPLTRSLRL